MHKHKLDEIEILRALAFLAIVLQHTLACYMYNDNLDAASGLSSAFLLLLIRFGVPMFVFITGLVLFYNHGEKELFYGNFIHKRFTSVFVPYFLWSVFYFVWLHFLTGTPDSGSALFRIGQHTLAGDAFYHLWFMVMVLQFYLVFPLFRKLILSCRNRPALLLGLTFALYIAYIWAYNHVIPLVYSDITSPVLKTIVDYRDRIFPSWFLYFIMGSVAGLYIIKIKEVLRRFSGMIILAFLATFAFIFYKMFLSAQYNTAGSYIINYQITLPLNLEMVFYLTASLLFLYYISSIIAAGYPNLTSHMHMVGRYSFGGYFVHPLILFYLNSFAKAYMTAINPVAQIFLVFIVCAIASLATCFVISKINIRFSNALVGKIS